MKFRMLIMPRCSIHKYQKNDRAADDAYWSPEGWKARRISLTTVALPPASDYSTDCQLFSREIY
jgi:hypothetical protein